MICYNIRYLNRVKRSGVSIQVKSAESAIVLRLRTTVGSPCSFFKTTLQGFLLIWILHRLLSGGYSAERIISDSKIHKLQSDLQF